MDLNKEIENEARKHELMEEIKDDIKTTFLILDEFKNKTDIGNPFSLFKELPEKS